VLWYSTHIDSNCTCNGIDDVVACIERNVARGLSGRWEVVAERADAIVVRPVFDRPRPNDDLCVLLRLRDGLIAEMRDFLSPAAALRYAGID
jgi:hypothetical protein